jgi:hypothetical protein
MRCSIIYNIRMDYEHVVNMVKLNINENHIHPTAFIFTKELLTFTIQHGQQGAQKLAAYQTSANSNHHKKNNIKSLQHSEKELSCQHERGKDIVNKPY